MFSPDDTIVAIATPPGRGGIGVVRISGPDAFRIAGALVNRETPFEMRRAVLAHVCGADPQGSIADEVVVTCFAGPQSYTGQDVAEVSAHGSPPVLRAIVHRAMQIGARLAEPGEFTLRAFLNGKRDLIQAEAVADLIAAVTPLQARTAFDQLDGTLTRRIGEIDRALFDLVARLEASLDFPDEGYHFVTPDAIDVEIGALVNGIDRLLADGDRGRVIREGVTVAIVGRPNVGKSSLFNRLVGADRAIVTDVPGTTRDLITETIDLAGIPVTFVDTAGSRETVDIVEREGVVRGERAAAVASVVIVVLDQSEPLTIEDEKLLARTAAMRRIVVANKADKRDVLGASAAPLARAAVHGGAVLGGVVSEAVDVQVSALAGSGVEELRQAIVDAIGGSESREPAALSNTRHIALLASTREHLQRARTIAAEELPEEFVLAELQEARSMLEEIVGRRSNDAVLEHIFQRFCIGK